MSAALAGEVRSESARHRRGPCARCRAARRGDRPAPGEDAPGRFSISGRLDVIVAIGGRPSQVAQQATSMIPIVMSVVIDPWVSGWSPVLRAPAAMSPGYR
jgi:hypothetical protein